MPRVLLVTYPWLPAFNGAVKHAATLARYLPEAGWDPIILARDFADGPVPADAALRLDWPVDDEAAPLRAVRALPVVRVPFAPRENRATRWRGALADERAGERPWGARRLARGALAATYPLYGDYPDDFRGWVAPAVRAGVAAVRQYGAGAVLSLSGPDSAHIAGGEIARAAGIPWIPLFRDLGRFRVGRGDGRTIRERLLHRELARRWLRGASRAGAVTAAARAHLEREYSLQVETLAVPFDPEERRVPPRRSAGAPLCVAHAGRVDAASPRVTQLLDALDALLARDTGAAATIRIELVGSGDDEALERRVAERPAAAVCRVLPRVAPAEAVVAQREADLLLVVDRDDAGTVGAHPSARLAEAFAARRPVLALADEEGVVARILAETRAGTLAPDVGAIVAALESALAEVREGGELAYRGDEAAIARYGGPEQARRLAALLDVASAERIGSWRRV